MQTWKAMTFIPATLLFILIQAALQALTVPVNTALKDGVGVGIREDSPYPDYAAPLADSPFYTYTSYPKVTNITSSN